MQKYDTYNYKFVNTSKNCLLKKLVSFFNFIIIHYEIKTDTI